MTAPATPPVAHILAVGDELLLGRTVDTNSAHISRVLTDLGFAVARIQVVGDARGAVVAAMRAAIAGSALVVVSGGLGPTDDDRTRHALAEVMGVELVEDPAAWRQVQAAYRRLRIVRVPAVNRRQALRPAGSRLLANDRGTAPGLLARVGDVHVACVPGVPHEMQAMVASLAERLPRLLGLGRPPDLRELWIAGIGESAAQELIGDLLSERDPQVGITVNELGHATFRVVGRPAQVRARIAALRRAVRPYLLPLPGLAPSLVGLLTRRRWTITAAESCTCGHVAAQLGAVPGASAVLRESLVAYHVAVKTARLGVGPLLIARHGVVSLEVAGAMAEGARRAGGADLAIATTGVAGPDGGSAAVPVGSVALAVASSRGTATRLVRVGGSRERVQRRAAAHALLLAWEVASGRLAPRRNPGA
jgi:nicotinamide-nucleotide amidase